MNIEYWRDCIDDVDAQLVRLLNERAKYVIEIGKIKKTAHMNVYDPEREAEIFRNVLARNQGPLDNQAIKRLFERIIDESRRIERLAPE